MADESQVTTDSQKREDPKKRPKNVLKTTQTKVTQSPKPKPRVTATNLHEKTKGDLVWRQGDYFLKRY